MKRFLYNLWHGSGAYERREIYRAELRAFYILEAMVRDTAEMEDAIMRSAALDALLEGAPIIERRRIPR